VADIENSQQPQQPPGAAPEQAGASNVAGATAAAEPTAAAPEQAQPQQQQHRQGGGHGQRGGFGGRGRGGGGGPGRGGPRGRGGDSQFFGKEQSDLSEKVIFINRSSKVVKGGRRFSFSALVVVGDKKGRVGLGLGKAGEVADAIRKGNDNAKQNLASVSLKDATIPHEVLSEFGGARILLRPASPGTGIIAGKTVRAVVESAGVKDVLSKSLGSKNAANVAKATLKALQHLRLREAIMKGRGIELRRRPAHLAEQVTA
jgi:small subunit ribosomal protein S5